jgi:hypothetical protein
VLEQIELPNSVVDLDVPDAVRDQIELARLRIQTFQDRWDREQIEQFVAADYYHVCQTLRWVDDTQLLIGKRFLEWGCGFAIVCAIADSLGFDAIGIEAEADLLAEGQETIAQWRTDRGKSNAELIHGNFLPPGAESLADDPTLPSLGHPVPCAYAELGLDLDDFAVVYAYPWPGEDDFHEAVFDRYAAKGAMLILFCGPNEIRLWRKTK